VTEVAKAKYSFTRPEVSYNKEKHLIQVDKDILTPASLRRACRCAACVEELTGIQILRPSDVSEAIKPLKMFSTGNYAHSIDWSDGHRSLYPYRQLKGLLQSDPRQSQEASTSLEIRENMQRV
jgi:DUF971 family protein